MSASKTFMTVNEIRYKQTFQMQVDLIEKILLKIKLEEKKKFYFR